MSRRTARAVERLDPAMAPAVRASAGEQVAEEAVRERGMELGTHPGGGMMLDRLEVGTCYQVHTTTFRYIGRLASKGIDYIELAEAAIVTYDGRHSTFELTGAAPEMCVEPTGGPRRVVLIPVDVIGPVSVWPFELFEGAV